MSELGVSKGRGRRDSAQQASMAFRSYYKETDIFLSSEGILKVISIIGCIVTSAVFLGGSPCAGAPPGLVASAGSVALAGGAALALLYAGVALRASLRAPTAWLYTDIIVSSVVGVLLLVTGALALALCASAGAAHYVSGPLAMATAVLVMGSAVLTYARAMRRVDAAALREPSRPGHPLPREHDV